MKNLLTILGCFFLINLTAQDWKTFTNHKEVLDIEKEGNTLWIATSGGLLEWDLQTETYYKFTTGDGLISNDIHTIAIDSEGRKWMATARGVSVYDGVSFINYTMADGLSSNYVFSLAIDSQDNKWLLTRKENIDETVLAKIDNQGVLSTISESQYFSLDKLVIDAADNVYMAQYQRIVKYSFDGIWSDFVPVTNDGVGHVLEMTVDENQELWTVSGYGLFHIDSNGNKTKYTNADGFNGYLRSIFIDSNQTKWIGTTVGFSKINSDNTFTNYSLPSQVKTIFEANGNILLGTENDVTTFDGISTWGSLETEIDLAGNWVRELDIAIDGSVWMSTENGVSKFASNLEWSKFGQDEGMICDGGHSILATSQNELFVSHFTECYGTSFIDIPSGDASFMDNDTFGFIFSMNEDLIGNVWLGYYAPPIFNSNYAAKISPNGDMKLFDFTTVLPSTFNNKTTAVANHPNGDVYFSTRYGIYYIDSDDEIHLFELESAATVFIDSQENIWFAEGDYSGPNHSLEKYTPSGDHIIYQNNEINDFVINEIIEDDQQNIWIASENGLFKLSPDSVFTRYSTQDGLADNNVTNIEIDSNGNMWISTMNGVSTTASISTATSNIENKTIQLQLYPNPISTTASLDFDLEKSENVQIEIYNVAGQILRFAFDGKKAAGSQHLEFDVAEFSQGIYFCKVKIGENEQVLKFVKI